MAIGCVKKKSGKYVKSTRKAPPYAANEKGCQGITLIDSTGVEWTSTPTKHGIYRWVRSDRSTRKPNPGKIALGTSKAVQDLAFSLLNTFSESTKRGHGLGAKTRKAVLVKGTGDKRDANITFKTALGTFVIPMKDGKITVDTFLNRMLPKNKKEVQRRIPILGDHHYVEWITQDKHNETVFWVE